MGISTRWSALAHEIEEALYTQPHYQASKLALDLQSKCEAFVDELMRTDTMEFKPNCCEDIQEALAEEGRKYREAITRQHTRLAGSNSEAISDRSSEPPAKKSKTSWASL